MVPQLQASGPEEISRAACAFPQPEIWKGAALAP
jgi:hypothetical protein